MIRVRQDVDLLQRLKDTGFNTGRIRRDRIFGQDTLTRMRHKQRLTMGELEAVCRLLGGQPGDYIEFVPDAAVGVGDVGSGGAEAGELVMGENIPGVQRDRAEAAPEQYGQTQGIQGIEAFKAKIRRGR